MYTVKVINTLWYCLKDQKTDKPEQNRVRKDLGMKDLQIHDGADPAVLWGGGDLSNKCYQVSWEQYEDKC